MEIVLQSGKKIGDGHPPYVVAEIGSNYRDLSDCLNSISQAKACGASAVKFQLYDHYALYGRDGEIQGALNPVWLPKLKEKADVVGIDFLCSAFSPELLDVVDKYVVAHKLASSEMCHIQMLEELRGYGKPVFMSMAGQHFSDIARALTYLSDGDTPTVLMYCVGGYPSNRYNPRAIADLKDKVNGTALVGLSDHSREIYSTTYRQDAAVIEKHVNFVGANGPDAPHSLNADEFKDFVSGLTALPEWTGPTKEEKDFITRHKRRLIATNDIPKGAALQIGVNYGVYRSLKDETHALSPWHLYEVDGLEAKKDIAAGSGIGPGDI